MTTGMSEAPPQINEQESAPVFGGLSLGKIDVRIVVLIFLGVVLSLAGAYRWFGPTPDFAGYARSYAAIPYSRPLAGTRFEPGYVLVAWVFRFVLDANFQGYVLFLIAAALTLKFTLIWKLTSSPVLTSIVYVLFLYFYHEYTQVRAALGLSFAYFAVYEALRGKHFFALVLFGLGTLFHYSVIAPAIATLVFLLVWNRPRASALLIAAAVIVLAPLQRELVLYVLREANPLAVSNLLATAQATSVRAFSTFPLLFYASVLACGIFLTPWREKTAGLLFFLGVVGAVFMIALRELPVIGARLMETLEMPILLLAFRGRLENVRVIPAILITVMAAGWCATVIMGLMSP